MKISRTIFQPPSACRCHTATHLIMLSVDSPPALGLTANATLAIESRFDLAYNAAHALALAALRARGYRSDNRYVVFQALPHTLGLPAPFGVCSPGAMSGATLQSTKALSMWMSG